MGTLTDTLYKNINRLSNNDADWVNFVDNYTEQIQENATQLTITPAIIDRYKNKFYHLMRDNYCPIYLVWIALKINDLNEYEDFVNKDFVYIPNVSHVQSLFRLYKTSSQEK